MDNSEELELANEQEFVKSYTSANMQHLKNESLMLFDYSFNMKKRYRLFYGIGVVYRVVKGEKFDLIYINFGVFKTKKPRLVVAYENHARRQTLTLKRGQVCQVYGMCRYYITTFDDNGVQRKRLRLGLYARALLGWYVPTMLDIKRMPINEDIVEPSENEKGLFDTFEDVLSQFMNGNGEEE